MTATRMTATRMTATAGDHHGGCAGDDAVDRVLLREVAVSGVVVDVSLDAANRVCTQTDGQVGTCTGDFDGVDPRLSTISDGRYLVTILSPRATHFEELPDDVAQVVVDPARVLRLAVIESDLACFVYATADGQPATACVHAPVNDDGGGVEAPASEEGGCPD